MNAAALLDDYHHYADPDAVGWIDGLTERLERAKVPLRLLNVPGLRPARLALVDHGDWAQLARLAAEAGCRLAGYWVEQQRDEFVISACVEKDAAFVILRTRLPSHEHPLASITPYFPAADRLERHARDLFGLKLDGHPDARRWTRHQGWAEDQYPLRKSYPLRGEAVPAVTPADCGYDFLRADGKGVYEIPVGPVHAGIIEPGHFRFQAVGETVLNLEERLGYVHRGVEKIAEGRDADGLARLAGRVSGDSTVAHAWAACMAMERSAAIDVPMRGLIIRAVLAECERIANHLGDIGAILNDVAFAFGFYQFSRLRELWLREQQRRFGHRLLMDTVVPGGVAVDPDDDVLRGIAEAGKQLVDELERLWPMIEDNASVQDRLVTTGVLNPALANTLGCQGYVGRASGVDRDLRRDKPYAPYDRLRVKVPVYSAGDVAARLRVRFDEARFSAGLIGQLIARLPAGRTRVNWQRPPAGAEGLGLVEGWRGETLAFVRFDEQGRIARYFARDPSWFNWPALEQLIHGNIVPDFPVCNKSVNGSYAGQDL